MSDIPTGSVTFLFTDIEGSIRLAHKFPDKHKEILDKHDRIIIDSVQLLNGFIFKSIGDAFYISFANAADAIHASVEIQKRTEIYLNEFAIKKDRNLQGRS